MPAVAMALFGSTPLKLPPGSARRFLTGRLLLLSLAGTGAGLRGLPIGRRLV